MLDIECLSNGNCASIVQIGACFFDRYTGSVNPLEVFSVNINIQSCIDAGLQVDGDTIKWWMDQVIKRGEPSWLKDPVPVETALGKFREFYYKINKSALVWSHATFDVVILSNAYRTIGQKTPYLYRNCRDIRTLVDLSGVHTKKEGEGDPKNHNALDDCIYQVKYCVECFNKLKEGK